MQRWHPLPAAVYSLVEQTAASVLLESAPSRNASSQSRLFLSPSRILTPRSAGELNGMFLQIEEAVGRGYFAAGHFSYECGNCFEPAARMRMPAAGQPLAWFGIYEECCVFDHLAGTWIGSEPSGISSLPAPPAGRIDIADIDVTLPESQYADRIARIHDAIRAGDVYQLNFTFPLRFRFTGGAAALYAELRRRQAVEYGAFVHGLRGDYVLSFSPELFFQVEQHPGGRRITTRPMKGTVRRGRTTPEDRQVAEWLQNDEKNRSENLMIVDLLRNDLGRLCEFGSVQVDNMFAVERHETLWQMTSTVSGELRPDVNTRDILRALFPSGSVTGAPKIRAMQLIAELESEPRNVYTGAIGYFSRDEAVFNVAIRTIELNGANARMGIGSGIVIDSDAADEYRECRLKAEFLKRPQPEFELLESLLWDNGYPLLEMHLDRMEDSAVYFDFEFDRAGIRGQLLAAGESIPEGEKRKVRLLLKKNGDARVEHELIAALSDGRAVRLCVARERVDPGDRFYFHKTTHRPLYARALKAAQEVGFDDVLFLNQAGEITETALANLFIETGGRWFTPRLESGLLAGVYRRLLLEKRPEIEQCVLRANDLKAADCVYVTNAVRGLRRAVIDWEAQVL